MPDPALIVSICSAALSLGAVLLSSMRVKAAHRANEIAASSAWASEVQKLLTAELQNAEADENLVRLFCNVPFRSKALKKEHRAKLNELRDESQRTVFTLYTYTDQKTQLQVTKAARDKIDDSFWDNSDLQMVRERGESLYAEYKTKAAEHVAELRRLMYGISSEKRKALLPSGGAKALPMPDKKD
jgi:hypothetical protein